MIVRKTASVAMRWDTFTFPIYAGTPVSVNGVEANSEQAFGLVVQAIPKKPNANELIYVMTDGVIDMEDIVSGYGSELSKAAMTALSGIHVFKAGKRINPADEDDEIAALSANIQAIFDMIADSYDKTSTYAVGEYCVHNSKLYICSTAIGTAETWNAEHWTETTVMDELVTLAT